MGIWLHTVCVLSQERVMMLAFGGPELVKEEAPDMDMRKIHWKQLSQGG